MHPPCPTSTAARRSGRRRDALVGLRHALMVAREYPLTLVFERSGSVQATLSVDYARFA